MLNCAFRRTAGQCHRSMYPSLLVTDWDGTITQSDTISLLADAAYISKPHFTPPFSHYVDIYCSAYAKYQSQFVDAHGTVNTLERERLFQRGMHAVEMSSITAIERDGLFRGVKKSQIMEQAGTVVMRDGAVEFLHQCLANNVKIIILSLNWSRSFIYECLRPWGLHDNIEVVSSDFEFTKEQSEPTLTGRWDTRFPIRTANDKLAYMKGACEDAWYVGDSRTDLLAALEAKKGIAISGTLLVTHAQQLGLRTGLVRQDCDLRVASWHNLAAYCSEGDNEKA